MSRTINEILTEGNAAQAQLTKLYTQITNEVNADANLAGLTSTSKTAEFNLWKYVWSVMSYIQEAIWGEAKAEIQTIADAAIPGTEKWFQKEILKFQYGDALSFDNVTAKYFYPTITPENQIVKRCSVTSLLGLTTVKVAKLDGGGNPVALTTPELNSLKTYIDQVKWAGSNIQAVSLAADLINAPMTVYYNGVMKLADIKPLIQAAFDGYFAALPFNGQYSITRHIDAVQAVPNVNDCQTGVVQGKTNAGSYVTIPRVYNPLSGHVKRDVAINFDVMITYVPQ